MKNPFQKIHIRLAQRSGRELNVKLASGSKRQIRLDEAKVIRYGSRWEQTEGKKRLSLQRGTQIRNGTDPPIPECQTVSAPPSFNYFGASIIEGLSAAITLWHHTYNQPHLTHSSRGISSICTSSQRYKHWRNELCTTTCVWSLA